MNGDLLTGEELAAHLKVSRQTVRDWARTGRIPEIRITSKVRRFDLGEVFAALKDDGAVAQEGEAAGR